MADEQPRERWIAPEGWPTEPPILEEGAEESSSVEPLVSPAEIGTASIDDDGNYVAKDVSFGAGTSEEGPVLFQNYEVPETPQRIPHLGHMALLGLIVLFGALCSELLVLAAMSHHMFGVTSIDKATTDIHYTLGSEVVLYLFTLIASLLIFPMVWHKGFFAGIQWNGKTAYRLRVKLISAAIACLVLASASSLLAPGPTNAPIDKIFRAPGAAWLLFIFGVTFAPFFEETFFRGFLLPALCTAADWADECIFGRPNLNLSARTRLSLSVLAMVLVCSVTVGAPISIGYALKTHKWTLMLGAIVLGAAVYSLLRAIRPATADSYIRPLAANGHPQWSFPALAVASIFTSIPFAMMHGEQTGYSVSALVLLAGVSTVLCAVRLATRSLASSALVHAFYNLVLFSVMLVSTHGFRHLDRI